MGSGFGSVGRVVASNARGPGFESSHLYIEHLFLSTVQTRRKYRKEVGNGQCFKKYELMFLFKCPFQCYTVYITSRGTSAQLPEALLKS